MANASPRDTRAGFDLYRSSGGSISLDELNGQLLEAGYGPVANRSYNHFQKLVANGVEHYISINRFDTSRASVPYDNASASGRYAYQHVDLGVRVLFAKGSQLFETFGRAAEIAEVGTVLRFVDAEVVSSLKDLNPQPGNTVSVRYLEAGRTIGGRIVEVDLASSPALIEIEYARLTPLYALPHGTALASVTSQFVVSGGDERQTLDLVGRRLYHFFELIEGFRSVSNGAGSSSTLPVYASPPVVANLSVASPASITLEVAERLPALIPILTTIGIMKVAGEFIKHRKVWLEGSGARKRNTLTDLEIEEKKLALERSRLNTAILREIEANVREQFPDSTIGSADIERIAKSQILPHLEALGEAGVSDLTISGPARPVGSLEGSAADASTDE